MLLCLAFAGFFCFGGECLLRSVKKWFESITNRDQELHSAWREGYFDGRNHSFDTGVNVDYFEDENSTRVAYDKSPLFFAAVNSAAALAVGTGATLGDMDDDDAESALLEWFELNDIDTFSVQAFKQYLIDGELLGVIARGGSKLSAAYVNLVDTRGGITVNTLDGNPNVVTSIEWGDRVLKPHEFAWYAHDTMFNKVRGTPPTSTAVESAYKYSHLLLTLRMRMHEMRGRLNAVYYALANNSEELERKANRYRSLPKHGHVVTLQMDRFGNSEKLEFTDSNTNAADSESDIRALLRTVAMVFGVPEHYLSIGDTANRATAEAMTKPMVRRMQNHQKVIREWLIELSRRELIRRFGVDKLYTVKTKNGVTQVPAHMLDVPWAFPAIEEDESNLDVVQYALGEGLISRETATEKLGFDPSVEDERLSLEGGSNEELELVHPE